MTPDDFITLLRRHSIGVTPFGENGAWGATTMIETEDPNVFDCDTETANDPVEAVRKLAEKKGWL